MAAGRKTFVFVDGEGASVIDIASKRVTPIAVGRRLRGAEITPDAWGLILYERTEEADIWLASLRSQ